MKRTRKHYHPAIQRSGMRLNANNAGFSVSNSNGTIKFNPSYGKLSKKYAEKSAQKKKEKMSEKQEADKKDKEEGQLI